MSPNTQPVVERQTWIEPGGLLALSTQCKLLAVTRSVVYDQKKRPQKAVDEFECMLLNKLDEEYTRHPFYGSRRMTKYLCGCGYAINRKRVQRLMQKLGLAGMAPGPDTSKPHPEHKLYPSQSGVEHQHHLHTATARICVSGCDY